MIQDNTFYFLKDEYFSKFPDKNLMRNHEKIGNTLHGRPCFYIFKDNNIPDIYWMVPISSKVEKYQKIHDSKVAKYKHCDTIVLGYVLDKKRAFLIQNVCPITKKFLAKQYVVNNKPVYIKDKELLQKVKQKTKRVLDLYNKGIKSLVFPDIQKIKQELINQLELEKQQDKKIESEKENVPKVRKRKLELVGINTTPPQIIPIRRRPKKVNKETEQPVNIPKKRKLILETNKSNSNERNRGR